MVESAGPNTAGAKTGKDRTDEMKAGLGENRVGGWTFQRGVLVAGYALAAIATLFVASRLWKDIVLNGEPRSVVLLALSGILFFGTVTFVQVFTETIKQEDQGKPRRSWFVFAYAFMLFALFAAIVPFILPVNISTDDIGARPIAVFVGCVDDREGAVPGELRCERAQNIATVVPDNADVAAAKPGAGQSAQAPSPRGMWIINLGGELHKLGSCGPKCHSVRGGLVVPLYVVILSLFGGAISLTRRVPEYQKRAASNYKQVRENQPKLELGEVREYLVFQIVQYISAPLIAITAYYVVNPGDTPAAVAIAFGAGFASEAILLMIRSVVEKVTPKNEKISGNGSIAVHVEESATARPVKGAEVRVVGQPSLRATAGPDGLYVFDDVPVGGQTVEVKYNNVITTCDVTVERGRSAPCKAKL